jgi:uncharacterized protein (DUF1697 family)
MMTTYVALLRGINVGGNNKVPMADLRALCTALVYDNVETYIQSGNVVFDTPAPEAEVVAGMEAALLATFGLTLSVVVRSAAELVEIVARNPFVSETDGTKLHVTCFESPLPAATVAKLDTTISPAEAFVLDGRDMYLHLPGGMGTSKLAVHVGQKLGKLGTTRNWNTVLKLADMSRR